MGYYVIDDCNIKEINIEEYMADKPFIAYIDVKELEENMPAMGLDRTLVGESIKEVLNFHTCFDVYEDYCITLIHAISPDRVACRRDTIVFILRKNQFLVIKIGGESNEMLETLESAVKRFPQNVTLEKVIFATLDTLLVDGNKNLEMYDKQIMLMEKELVAGRINNNLNRDIYEKRRQLSQLKNYYQRLVDIGERLQENELEILNREGLRYIKIFTARAQRLSNNAQTLGESLIHIREALDASLNYSMNRIMKVFTVLSVIFQPLTLITSWYGMNFVHMPEIAWRYGYVFVATLCVSVLFVCLFFFKKKKWL